MKTLITSFLFLIMSFFNIAQSTLDSGLVAYFPFNGNTIDESGNGHDGTINGNAALVPDRFNIPDRAFTFPDQSSNISLANSTNLNLESGFTFNSWVKYKNTYSVIIGKHICGYVNGLVLGIDYDGQFQLWLGDAGWQTVRTSETLIEDKWYMLTATYDRSSGTAKIYLDGQLENSANISYTNFSPYPISIGEVFQNNCQPANMPGAIDEVKIYNRALNDAEILAEYNLSNTDLVAYYPFNGNANDESGNANNPTFIGSGVTLTTDRFGNADKAYYFDGNTDSYIRIPADNFPTTDRTISFWFYAEQLDNHPTPLSYGGDVCYNSVLMIINKGGYPNAYTVLSHCAANFISAPYSEPPINNWYNLTMTISGVTQKIFINGELQQTENTFSTPTFVAGKSAILGALLFTDGYTVYVDPSAGYFKGKLDDFRFYNTAMTDLEVQNLYNSEANGLVAFFPFNGNAIDESTNGNNGINHNGIFSKDRFGNDNSSMLFSGNDSYVEGTNPGNNLPTGNSPRTITAWIKEYSFHPWGNNIFHYGLDQAAPTNFHLYTTDVIRFGNGYDFGVVAGTTPIVDSTWHFVAGVYEGGSEHIAKVYVDGKLDGTGVLSTEPNTILGSNWKIGRFMTGSNNFNGDIDELKVYNFALTYQEIFDLYEATTTAPNLIFPANNSTLINPQSLVLDWDSLITASSYRIVISNDSLFNSTILDTLIQTSSFDFYNWPFVFSSDLYWKVRTINGGGIGPWSEINHFNIILTDVEDEKQLPTEFALMQNYPNPFNPSTVISYQLPVSCNVKLKVFDVLGNEVATLVDEYKPAGSYEVEFQSKVVSHQLSSGIYYYQLKAGEFIQTKKMLIIK